MAACGRERGTEGALLKALACLVVFLMATSLPVETWLMANGVGEELANVVHAALLAAVSGALLVAVGPRESAPWPLLLCAGAACVLAFVPGWGRYVAWCAFTGIAEETLFCGVLFPCLCRAWGSSRGGMLVCATLFAVCHVTSALPLGWMLLRMVVAWPFSLTMFWLFRRTGRLWVPVLCHAITDVILFA